MTGIMKTKLAVFLLSIAFSVSAYSSFYKWTDANGKVHYSDSPPAHVKAEGFERMKTESEVSAEQQDEQADGGAKQTAENQKNVLCSKSVSKISATYSSVSAEIEKRLKNKEIEEYQYQETKSLLDKLKSMANIDACLNSSPSAFKTYKCLAVSQTVNECIN